MKKLNVRIITALVLVGLSAGLVTQYRAQANLREKNLSLEQQLNQQDKLTQENQRLSDLIVQTAKTNSKVLPDDRLSELLRLRGEVTRLKADAQELARLKETESKIPVNRLRQMAEKMPNKLIPELQNLEKSKWTQDANKGNLDTEDGVREVLGNLRRAAKMRSAGAIGQALDNFIKSNGQLPNDVNQLSQYSDPPLDGAVLERYQLLRSGNLSDIAPGEPVLSEIGPVDDQYDTLFKIGVNGYWTLEGVGKWQDARLTNTWNFNRTP